MSANIYDFETGVIKNDEIEREVELAQAEAEQEAIDISNMSQSPGWERLEAWLLMSANKLKDNLVDEQDPKKIIRLQQQIIAAEHLVGVVHHFQREAQALVERRKNGSDLK
jgi:hypothetical protein